MKQARYSVAVLGATGLVGQEILAVLEQRQFPLADLQLYASLRSAGDEVTCGGLTTRVELLDNARFDETDIVILAAGEQVSAEWIDRATASGAVAIDTSQLFTGDPDVPVIVPEVNAADAAEYTARNIIVSPDAPAIALAVILKPLEQAAGLTRVVATSFEPVSGAGREGIEELHRQTVELMNGRSAEAALFPHRVAFNLVPQVGQLLAGGVSVEEQHTAAALRRLLHAPELVVSVTRTRAPIFYGAALAVNVETAQTLSAADAAEALRTAPGVLLQDDPGAQLYPMPATAVGEDWTAVGRIREEPAANVLDLWASVDNLRKGSAVNVVQIAELLIREYL